MDIYEHNNFQCQAEINRLTSVEGGPVTGYHVDVKVWCADCNEPFHFVGVPFGMSLVGGAMVSIDGLILNCKLAPGKLEISNFGKAKYTI
jgi:hypothetical protein